jgi:FkbM family methyltransferase
MKHLLNLAADLRSYARRAGLTRIVNRLRRPGQNAYEDRFREALLRAVQPGDCVWDVGANVGYYTVQLAGKTGEGGMVYAFEPAPACADKLRLFNPNVKVIESALGDMETFLPLAVAEDPLASTHSLCTATQTSVQVRVATGDRLIATGEAHAPNVIKIDVEGFEIEVLKGLEDTLRTPQCRAVFAEIHFGVLDRRGDRYAPSRAAHLLQEAGFRTRWLDASHIAAVRS